MTHRPPPSRRVPRADDPGPPPPAPRAPRADDVLTATEARLDLTRLADRVDHVDRDLLCVYLDSTRHAGLVTASLDRGGPTAADDLVRVDVDHTLVLEATPAEAVELARALLVLAYHHDRAAAAERVTGRVVDRFAAHERDRGDRGDRP